VALYGQPIYIAFWSRFVDRLFREGMERILTDRNLDFDACSSAQKATMKYTTISPFRCSSSLTILLSFNASIRRSSLLEWTRSLPDKESQKNNKVL
jgi:hypothetical protein